MSVLDQELVEKFIFDALNVSPVNSAAPAGIHADIHRGNGDQVGIVFGVIAGEAQRIHETTVRENQFEVHVRAIHKSESKKAALAAARAAQDALASASSTVSGASLYAVYLGAINEPYTEDGVRFQQVGGRFLVKVRPVG